MASCDVRKLFVKVYKFRVKKGLSVKTKVDKRIRGGGKMDNEQIDNGSVRLKYGIFFWDYGNQSHNPEESLSLFDLFLFSHRCRRKEDGYGSS